MCDEATNMDTKEKPTALSKLDTTSPSDTPSIEEGNVNVSTGGHVLSNDEYHLATLDYKQEFLRSLGFFESWAATFTSMNFMSGIPVLFGFVMYTSGPKAAFAN
jgi:hypothetical protein